MLGITDGYLICWCVIAKAQISPSLLNAKLSYSIFTSESRHHTMLSMSFRQLPCFIAPGLRIAMIKAAHALSCCLASTRSIVSYGSPCSTHRRSWPTVPGRQRPGGHRDAGASPSYGCRHRESWGVTCFCSRHQLLSHKLNLSMI